jgi:hypothetical protein
MTCLECYDSAEPISYRNSSSCECPEIGFHDALKLDPNS